MSHKVFRTVFCLILVLGQFATGITPALAAPPANDNFADAQPITSFPFNASVDNTEATAEPGEPADCLFPYRSVWYAFTPTENMALQVGVEGSQVGGAVTVFLSSGPAFSDLAFLACASAGSPTNFSVDAGETYYLRVDTFAGQSGILQFNLQEITPPSNANFANAEAITTLPFNASVDNTNASVEFGEPAGCGSRFRTVWYSFTPSENMALRAVMPPGQGFNYLSIFLATGPAFSDLRFLTCAFADSSTNFQADAGNTYSCGLIHPSDSQVFCSSTSSGSLHLPMTVSPTLKSSAHCHSAPPRTIQMQHLSSVSRKVA